MQLWDVCTDQDAVDLVRNVQDPRAASKQLVEHALARFSTDNLSCMVVRFDKDALLESQNNKENPIGVETDQVSASGKISEVDKIVGVVKKQIAEGGATPVGVSASNSGKGHDAIFPTNDTDDASFTPTALEGSLEEEPAQIDGTIEQPSDKPATEPDPPKEASPKQS